MTTIDDLVTNDVFNAADHARTAFLRDVDPNDQIGALVVALEAAMNYAINSVDVRWVRGSEQTGGVSPAPAEQFPISPFEAWYILRGYEVTTKKDFKLNEVDLYGRLEGSSKGLMLKE